MNRAYYNEHDPFAAAWLRNLIHAGLIAPGDVDERSIEDVTPNDLKGYTQCHFFAGIGGWSHALRLAGWPDDRPVWTGSCPCQPFSTAGKGKGHADERHLWPAWFHLIEQCQPDVIFGEQVEAAIRHGWLDLVQTDLEGIGYAFGAVGIPAAGVGAPHIRQRLWFVAESELRRCQRAEISVRPTRQNKTEIEQRRDVDGMADTKCDAAEPGRIAIESREGAGTPEAGPHAEPGRCRMSGELAESHSEPCGQGRAFDGRRDTRGDAEPRAGLGGGEHFGNMGDPDDTGPQGRRRQELPECADQFSIGQTGSSFWSACDWFPCRDGKARPVEPGTFPLAHGVPARVGRLRGYGNAIVPQVAAEIIRAYLSIELIR